MEIKVLNTVPPKELLVQELVQIWRFLQSQGVFSVGDTAVVTPEAKEETKKEKLTPKAKMIKQKMKKKSWFQR